MKINPIHILVTAAVIATLVVACTRVQLPSRDEEIPPSTYYSLGQSLEFTSHDDPERVALRTFMADDKITYSELGKLNAIREKKEDDAVRGDVLDIKKGLKS